jgi:5-methyltetrahydrofolate--homocysteine methyltransferase
VYDGRLFYGKDAFEGLHVMDRLGEIKRGGADDPAWGRVPSESRVPSRLKERYATDKAPVELPDRSPSVADDNPVFVPPFTGSRVVKGIAVDDVAAYINETALFRNQWQFRPESGENDEAFKDRIRPILREQLSSAKAAGLLVPQVVYGYFPVNGDGQDLVVWADESRDRELTRFTYPRQHQDPFLCIADFFRPIESAEVDYAAFHIVTMGPLVSEATAKLFADDRYQEYLLLHGLGVEMAEALAEYWHRRVREELGIVADDPADLQGMLDVRYRGARFSLGYGACPNLEDRAKIAALLEPGRIGVELSEEFQLHPEQSTSALVVHHPEAQYFNAT